MTPPSMVLVLPFCVKDGDLALKNLLWMEELDGRLPFDVILSHDDATPGNMVSAMKEAATRIFDKVDVFWYPRPIKTYWPFGPNVAWQEVARYMACVVKRPWLFLEADAVPIRKGWLTDIRDDYVASGKAFAGHIVEGMGHVNGSCVYPPDVAVYAPDAFRVAETAWDVVIGAALHLREGGILSVTHPAHTLFQHCWNVNPETGKAWNGNGDPATFKNMNDVFRLVDLSMGIFHRCKDGTLIEMLRKFHKDPSWAMVPQHTSHEHPSVTEEQEVHHPDPVQETKKGTPHDKDRRSNRRNRDTPQQPLDDKLPKEPSELAASSGDATSGVDVGGGTTIQEGVEIFIVTYGLPTRRQSGQVVSDFDWLAWCLKAIRKHCQGFQGITLAIPARDAGLLKPIATEHAKSKCGLSLRVKMFSEPTGKGFLMHEAVMATADEFVPPQTKFVLHVDADVIFKEPVTPNEYFKNGKPVYVWRTYESLMEVRDGQKVVSDCYQWKGPTEAQLGFTTDAYTMARHPSGFPIGFYKRYRQHIESIHGKPFMDYMMEGKNSHPSDRMDFTAMGSLAFHAMKDEFHWIDISGGNHLAPPDRQKCYWSHGGITDYIKKEMEGFL